MSTRGFPPRPASDWPPLPSTLRQPTRLPELLPLPWPRDGHFHVLPVMPYDDARAQLETGDLLVASGRYLFSRLVRWGTRSQASHVGVIYRVAEADRVLVLESVEVQGFRFAPLSTMVTGPHAYRGEIVVLRLKGSVRAEGVRAASQWGLDQLAKPYAYAKVAYLALRLLMPRLGWWPKPRPDAYICSEAAAKWYALAGVKLAVWGDAPGFVTPAQLLMDPAFELIGRLL